MTTIYVTIGNSDNRLTQQEWAAFRADVDEVVRDAAAHVYGAWVSPSADPFQNACWAFSLPEDAAVEVVLMNDLRSLAEHFRQDSIAWAEAPVEMIRPTP